MDAVGGAAVRAKVGAAIGTLITPGIGTGIGAVLVVSPKQLPGIKQEDLYLMLFGKYGGILN